MGTDADSSNDNISSAKGLGGLPAAAASSRSVNSTTSDGYGSSDEHIFKDPTVAAHWRAVFESARYENRHRFDPSYTWTAEEEKKLVRKVS